MRKSLFASAFNSFGSRGEVLGGRRGSNASIQRASITSAASGIHRKLSMQSAVDDATYGHPRCLNSRNRVQKSAMEGRGKDGQ